jgi:hypothetical protein
MPTFHFNRKWSVWGQWGKKSDGGWQQKVVRIQVVGNPNSQEVDSSSCKSSSGR